MPVKIKQRDITDCGAACLASIAAHYKLRIPVSRIRQLAGTDKKGTNILGLVEASRKMGFTAKGVRGEFESLFKIPETCNSTCNSKGGIAPLCSDYRYHFKIY
jgi:ATP-binding cassette, subfamily C, bacteriocin exporter